MRNASSSRAVRLRRSGAERRFVVRRFSSTMAFGLENEGTEEPKELA